MITFDITVKRPSMTVEGKGTLASGITVLTGQSGSGKSTIIKSIAGLVKPNEGFIYSDTTAWFDRDHKIWISPQKRYVGYMPQGNIVFPHLSVLRNITYSQRGDRVLLKKIFESLHLTSYKDTKAGCLSGGEQQRVALGRALYAKPVILLLDEPLSALDWNLRDRVRQDLVNTIKEWEIPCLWVTHDKEEAQLVGKRQWYCEKGKLEVTDI
ncbi:ATP-binding cassette domain-containing protein [Veillonella montpellierensis]|uniref:ATP-binding cassette domain-containing protein n=1 Tax=Veillonella montpellierensis TaxID=187328 RepID=UPI0023F6A0E0|nr:ATP-binding cassette domain-containing protein [Veillonella montpellierensis]